MSLFGNKGKREIKIDVHQGNVMEIQVISNIVKTCFIPQVLDKMLVDDIGDGTITNNGTKILKLLKIVHLAKKVLVEFT